jgi:CHASE2 domain-containing sensor protein
MARAASTPAPVGAGKVVVRVLAIVFGAYAASAAIVAAGVAGLILAGVNKSDAFTTCSILGFLIYTGLALWAAAARRLVPLIASFLVITAIGAAIGFLPALIGGT